MKLTYKKSFWILFVFSIVLAIYQYGKTNSLEVELAFKKINFVFLKSDTHVIGEIASKRLYDKNEIESFLNLNHAHIRVDKKGDTLFLDNTFLIFKNDSLISIIVD
ncbi:hypothetical protein [Winogradskyella pacifica]|uniref:hypothetical protein n=1 Tax=Winogradskyella pacifica TaxID=664642 RepID=UPI0015C83897|nr:hypothetical protein [Winogradskyella pacifica]